MSRPVEPLDLIRKVVLLEAPDEAPWVDYVPVSASEVASACSTEVLIEVLVKRGVLTREEDQYWPPATHVDGSMKIARLVTEWKPGVSVPRPAGGVS